jgi:hypothetical protein
VQEALDSHSKEARDEDDSKASGCMTFLERKIMHTMKRTKVTRNKGMKT